ncbi:hypothetical protein ACP70R_016125 [Stipagrostis hirtigluma subsp. patula]
MSTAVAAGMLPAHGGFRASEKGKKPDSDEGKRDTNGFFVEEEDEEEDRDDEAVRATAVEEALSESSSIGAASSDSSSIGENSSSEKEEEGEEEVESKLQVEGLGMVGLGTLESLEDALPIKRGLSNFYAGKSKSFTSLKEAAAVAAAKEIAKPENPFNKRRRVLAAWSRRRASCSALATAYLPPLLAPDHAVLEEDDEEAADRSDDDDEGSGNGSRSRRPPSFPSPRLSAHAQLRNPKPSSFRSSRSFSMTDLQNASYN